MSSLDEPTTIQPSLLTGPPIIRLHWCEDEAKPARKESRRRRKTDLDAASGILLGIAVGAVLWGIVALLIWKWPGI